MCFGESAQYSYIRSSWLSSWLSNDEIWSSSFLVRSAADCLNDSLLKVVAWYQISATAAAAAAAALASAYVCVCVRPSCLCYFACESIGIYRKEIVGTILRKLQRLKRVTLGKPWNEGCKKCHEYQSTTHIYTRVYQPIFGNNTTNDIFWLKKHWFTYCHFFAFV